MLRPILPFLALATLLLACEADVEEACLSGPCGPPPPSTTTTGAGGGGGSAPTVGDYPCDVYAALKATCFQCHTTPTQNGAPFPLLTWEDTRGFYGTRQRWERMGMAIDSGFMPLGKNPDLTMEQKTVLLEWLAQGALPEPDGQGCDCNDPAACP